MRPIQRMSARVAGIADMLAARPVKVNNPVVAGREDWQKDSTIDAFKTSNLDAKFSCNCGETFVPSGMHRCACGQTWNAFIIGDNEKTAGKVTKIVRTVPEFRERILATKTPKKKMAGWVKNSLDAGVPSFVRAANDAAPVVFDKQADNMGDTPPGPASGSSIDRGMSTTPSATPSVDPGMGTDRAPAPMAAGGEIQDAALTGTSPTTSPQQNPMGSMMNPLGTPPRQTSAAGGYAQPKVNNPATSAPAATYKAPAPIKTPAASVPATAPTNAQWGPQNIAPAVAPALAPTQQPIAPMIQGQPGVAGQVPGRNPVQQQQPLQPARVTHKMAFSEEEFRLGWALASADGSLPNRKLHASFIEGYVECLKEVVADNAPGNDTIAPVFAPADPDKNNSMSDYTDTMKGKTLPDYRDQLADKLDGDNEAGQGRSDKSMTDLTGWKSSALINELARRQQAK